MVNQFRFDEGMEDFLSAMLALSDVEVCNHTQHVRSGLYNSLAVFIICCFSPSIILSSGLSSVNPYIIIWDDKIT